MGPGLVLDNRQICIQADQLKEAGEKLSSRIGCPFIHNPPEYAYHRRFHENQIRRVMRSLIRGIKERAGSMRRVRGSRGGSSSLENTDLHIVMCTRKGRWCLIVRFSCCFWMMGVEMMLIHTCFLYSTTQNFERISTSCISLQSKNYDRFTI